MKVLTKPGVEKLWANVLDKIKTETDNKANVIVDSITGKTISIENCIVGQKLKGLSIYGKTTQDNIMPSFYNPTDITGISSGTNINISLQNEDSTYNSFSFSTPHNMFGVPIHYGSNFKNLDKLKWLCDEIDFEKGVFVQRLATHTFTGQENWWNLAINDNDGIFVYQCSPNNLLDYSSDSRVGLCSHANNNGTYGKLDNSVYFGINLTFTTSSHTTIEEWKAFLVAQYNAGNPVTVLYQLSKPIEMPLTEDMLTDYDSLYIQYANTHVMNSIDAEISISYMKEAKAYIDSNDTRVSESFNAEIMSYTHIPRVVFTGSTAGMSKDNEVVLGFQYYGAANYINDGNNSGKREDSINYSGYAKVKWQGSSSIQFPKKNYTIKLYSDENCENKMPLILRPKWGSQNKYCMKANFIDPTHCRNVIAARLWGRIVASRPNYDSLPEQLRNSPNNGAIDGYPVLVFINEKYMGIYTMNIPKDDWMFGMTNGEGTNTVLCGEYYNDATHFRAPSLIDGTDWGYEVEPADKSWVANSFNAIYNALILPASTNEEVATKKAALETCLDIYSVIDYYIFLNKFGLTDNLGKNQLMLTYDGTKWIMSAYDLDTAFGLVWSGAKYHKADKMPGMGSNDLIYRISYLYSKELAERKAYIDSLLTKSIVSDELMNFAIDIPQEAFMREAKLWPDMAGANMNGINQIQDFLSYHESDSVPTPTASDAGKILRVNNAGAYILDTLTAAEEVNF